MTVQLQNRNKATLQNVCSRPISMFYKASPLQIHTHFLKFKVCSSSSPHFKIIIYLMKRYTYICVNIDHKFEQFIHNVINHKSGNTFIATGLSYKLFHSILVPIIRDNILENMNKTLNVSIYVIIVSL